MKHCLKIVPACLCLAIVGEANGGSAWISPAVWVFLLEKKR